MPSTSNCQLLIHAALQHTLRICACHHQQCQRLRLRNYSSSASSDTENSTDNSVTSTSSSSSSSSSSNNHNDSGNDSGNHNTSSLSLSSNAECGHALRSLHHSYFQSMFHTHSFLSGLLSTCILFPHDVSKCSQLGLVLICYKDDDPVHFRRNLRISPRTFDVLISLIQDHPSFHNNSQLDQWPIPYQLAIALFWFGHFGSAASVLIPPLII